MADCTKTSIAQTASTYERSSATAAALLTASSNITLVSGKLGWMFIGMSNQDLVSTRVRQLYLTDPQRNTNVTIVRGGRSGYTARQWSDPANDVWSWLETRVSTVGLVPSQIQIISMKMTNAYPGTYGAMTAAQVRAIVNELKTRYVNAQLLYMSGINYEGYSDDAALSADDRDRVPPPYAHGDSLLLASLVGTLAIPSDFLDNWADGTTANSRSNMVGTATAACDPLAYACSDVENDGIHPTTAGIEKLAVAHLERLRIAPEAAPLWTGWTPGVAPIAITERLRGVLALG